ncbi:MAG: SIS domain-containing protein [Butyricicoccus sp.]|nr:SIS domain-containing protein [Butyricicoccus sp.]MBQ8585365.1 SIS domain-containing protein [Butyricicoccus sp.]
MNLMRSYIEEQPALARRMVDERSTLCAEFTERFKDTPVRRIILFGSGSSNHAARMAKPILERALGVEVTPIVPTRISELDHVPEDGLFWFAISQSGISTNTYHLIRNLQAKGIPVTAITGGHDTPIAQCADCSVELPCGEENIGAKTKGQVASALALILLGLEWGRVRGTCDPAFYSEMIDALSMLSDQMSENLRRSSAWCDTVLPSLAHAPHLYVLSKGNAQGGAMEGTLKLLETIYRPISYYEFEEFLHGIQNALDETSHLILLMPDAEDSDFDRALRLLDFAHSVGAHCLAISRGRAACLPDSLVLETAGCELLASLEYVLPLQLLSAELSAYCGIDTSKRRYPDFYTLMESKL